MNKPDLEQLKKELDELDYTEKNDVFDFYHKWFSQLLDYVVSCV